MVAIAQLVESRIVIPVVKGSSPFSHPILQSSFAGVAKLVDAPDLGSGALGVRVRVSSPAPTNYTISRFPILSFTFNYIFKVPINKGFHAVLLFTAISNIFHKASYKLYSYCVNKRK